ncbi:DUF1827 family protein [Desemzia sp. FAM 23989]|uniref:DUF1827 family protein n=1 Tax=Desemzia sp. FAM 23989 TaxID=3259523 RepID=UPI0038889A37
MKLIDVTNSHSHLVNNQLENTDAVFIKVFSLGSTTVIFSGAPTHQDVILQNKNRNIKNSEIHFAIENILEVNPEDVEIFPAPHLVELSIKV